MVGATPDGTFESGKRNNQKKLAKGNFYLKLAQPLLLDI